LVADKKRTYALFRMHKSENRSAALHRNVSDCLRIH